MFNKHSENTSTKMFVRGFKLSVLEITCTAKSISTHRRLSFLVKIQVAPFGYLCLETESISLKENIVEGLAVCYFLIYCDSI